MIGANLGNNFGIFRGRDRYCLRCGPERQKMTKLTAINTANPRIMMLRVRSSRPSCLSIIVPFQANRGL